MRVTHIPHNVTALAAEVAAKRFRQREAERGIVDIGELARTSVVVSNVTAAVLGDPAKGQSISAFRTARRESFRERRIDRLYAGYPEDVSSTAAAVAAVSGCRFCYGDPREAGFRFCDAPREAGKSYCENHRRGRSAE